MTGGGHRAADDRAGAFHSKAGWYWRRNEDSSVTVWPGEGADQTFDADTWASIVASVSAGGDGYVTHALATKLHAGEMT